jgi:hypothetical protein
MSKEWFIKEGGQVCFKSDNAELNGWDIQSLVDCLNGKEIKITELEAKLAVSDDCADRYWKQLVILEEENNQLKQRLKESGKIEYGVFWFEMWQNKKRDYDSVYKAYIENCAEVDKLKHQLKEKERLIGKVKQIVDKLRDKKFAGETLVNAVNAVYEPLYQNKYDEVEELKNQSEEKEKEIEIYKKALTLAREYMFKVMCAEDVPSEEWFIEYSKEENNRLLETIKAKDKEIEKQSEIIQETATTTYHKLMEKDIIFHLNKHKEELEEQVVKQEKELEYIQKQLAEKDQAIESLQEINQSLGQTCNNNAKEIEKLRKELAEKIKKLKN